jgi:acetylornithine deacetylase/succinyl-diaminopimelate desuccinylase-like protein
MARRLIDAGLPASDVQVLQPDPRQGMLVARFRGTGQGGKPILLMAHLDVVDARREDWSFAPYEFREADGHYYGRGTNDNKAGAAMLVANFVRMRREGFVPTRDLIIVLSSDEETQQRSIAWVVNERRDLIDAEFALNTDGGGGELKNGKPITFSVQAAEKVYLSFVLEVRNKGGHSSVPVADNAIYRLSAGLGRLAAFHFPVRLTDVSRAYFERSAAGQDDRTAADMRAVAKAADPAAAARLSVVPFYNSVMRTTCVATRLFGGHADNALPQLARATVNCRMLPIDPPDSVEATLRRVLGDTAITLARVEEAHPSPPSPLLPEVMGPVESLAKEMWPSAVVIPEMSTGATDGIYTRNAGIPTYGVSAMFDEVGDVRAHGRDERIGVDAYHKAAEYWYRLVKRLASGALQP